MGPRTKARACWGAAGSLWPQEPECTFVSARGTGRIAGCTASPPAQGWGTVTVCAAESSPEKSENLVFAPVQVPPLTPRLGSGPHLTFALKSRWAGGAFVF